MRACAFHGTARTTSTAPSRQWCTKTDIVLLQDDTGALAHSLRRPDGIQLYVRQYNVSSSIQARGVVVLVHGWTWHSGYFAPFAHYLTDNGMMPLLLNSHFLIYLGCQFCSTKLCALINLLYLLRLRVKVHRFIDNG